MCWVQASLAALRIIARFVYPKSWSSYVSELINKAEACSSVAKYVP